MRRRRVTARRRRTLATFRTQRCLPRSVEGVEVSYRDLRRIDSRSRRCRERTTLQGKALLAEPTDQEVVTHLIRNARPPKRCPSPREASSPRWAAAPCSPSRTAARVPFAVRSLPLEVGVPPWSLVAPVRSPSWCGAQQAQAERQNRGSSLHTLVSSVGRPGAANEGGRPARAAQEK